MKRGYGKRSSLWKKFDGAHEGMVRGMLAPERIESQTADQLKQIKYYSEKIECTHKASCCTRKF
ncbi:hypothetical protein RCO48_20815 [Peribacillus frigoritolerans]|nr:hypothetical protein [Peribacillus frigoritolerans]